MGLGLPVSTSGGDRVPVLKYDGRAGRLHRVDRSNASGNWETNEVEVTNGFQAIFDLENIETGWLSFPKASAPSFVMTKIGNPMPERPNDQHKSGFRVLMKLGKASGGDVREMAANSQVSIKGMDALYDAWLAHPEKAPGKLPVVTLAGTTQVKSSGKDAQGNPQSSTNYQPLWSIVKVVDRPPELTADGAPQAANQGAAQPVAQARTTSQAAPAVDLEDEF